MEAWIGWINILSNFKSRWSWDDHTASIIFTPGIIDNLTRATRVKIWDVLELFDLQDSIILLEGLK